MIETPYPTHLVRLQRIVTSSYSKYLAQRTEGGVFDDRWWITRHRCDGFFAG